MTLPDVQAFLSHHQSTIVLLASASLVAFVVSIVLLPLVLIRLPADFFVRPPRISRAHPVIGLFLKVLKHALGLLLLALGFIMLFIPGQGILTMLMGVGLLDFPRKRELQVKIATSPRVRQSLDWLRHKTKQPLFIFPEA